MMESTAAPYPQGGATGRAVPAPEYALSPCLVQLQSHSRSDRRGSSNSLRAAIQAANASGQDCLIELQAGTYTLTIKNINGQENNAAEGDLDITDSGRTVTIEGQGARASIVNGGGAGGIDDRVFQVLGGANAVFSQLTIEGGVANDDGTAGVQPGITESDGGGILALTDS